MSFGTLNKKSEKLTVDLILPKNILVVDSDSTIGKSIEQTVAKMGVEVTSATDVTSALESYASNSYEAVLVDSIFSPIGGLAMIQKWRNSALIEKRNCGFVLLTGNQIPQDSEALVRELGEINVMSKPLSLGSLISCMANARENNSVRIRRMAVVGELQKMAASGASEASLEKKALDNIKVLGSDAIEVVMDIFLSRLGLIRSASRLIDQIGINMTVPPSQLINARGRLLLHSGQNELALKAFEEADLMAPSKIDRIHKMINLYLDLQIPDKGVEKMREIIKLTPESPNLKFDFLSSLVDAGFDINAKELAIVVSSATEVVRHYNNQGVAMVRHGHRPNFS